MDTVVQAKIAALNDKHRKTLGANVPFGTMITPGVRALNSPDNDDFRNLIRAVINFDDFRDDNDPYNEHDFGTITLNQLPKVFWKIDYYDPSHEYWLDPLDPECQRVLTIMLAEEY